MKLTLKMKLKMECDGVALSCFKNILGIWNILVEIFLYLMYYLIEVGGVRDSHTQGGLMITEENIKEFAKVIGIDLIGFTDGNSLEGIKDYFIKRKLNHQISELGPQNLEEKYNPRILLKDCQSIIAIGMPYELTENKTEKNHGHLSSGGIGIDYHKALRVYLEKIISFIEKNLSTDLSYKICVDTCPLSDREIAYKSGIGYYGKNNFIISHQYGSAINIGYILLDVPIKSSCQKQPVEDTCGTCTRCIKACPGKAIAKDGFKIDQCIAQLSQTKKELTDAQRELLGKNIYGCDICQRICPKNKDVSNHSLEASQLNLIELIHLSNKAFKNKFKDRGFTWRGNGVIKRNAIIALGNEKLKENYDALLFLLEHPSITIRRYTLWALYHSDAKRFREENLSNKELAIEKKRILERYKKS